MQGRGGGRKPIHAAKGPGMYVLSTALGSETLGQWGRGSQHLGTRTRGGFLTARYTAHESIPTAAPASQSPWPRYRGRHGPQGADVTRRESPRATASAFACSPTQAPAAARASKACRLIHLHRSGIVVRWRKPCTLGSRWSRRNDPARPGKQRKRTVRRSAPTSSLTEGGNTMDRQCC